MSFAGRGIFVIAVALCASVAISLADRAESTPQDVFDGMRGGLQSAKAKGVHARYQWDLSGSNGGQWWIEVNDGTCKMGKGQIDHPNVTFGASDKDWVAIGTDELSAAGADFSG